MSAVTNKTYTIAGFKKNLDDFTRQEKGPILQRTGTKRNYRYRFEDPLLPSLAIMKALVEKQISMEELQRIVPRVFQFGDTASCVFVDALRGRLYIRPLF